MEEKRNKVEEAKQFAERKHQGQFRKGRGRVPFIKHPLEVADILGAHLEASQDLLAAAILHDVVEDTSTGNSEIASHFGEKVATIVAELTDNKSLPKSERVRHMQENLRFKSEEAKLIKIADKICNVRDVAIDPPEHWDFQRRITYLDQAKELIGSLNGTEAALEALFYSTLEKSRKIIQFQESVLEN